MSDDTELVDRVRDAVLAVPGVADLHGGVFGEAGTYLPGRKVAGIRLRDDVAEVHVSVHHGPPVPQTADSVRAAVAAVVDTPVHVIVEDILGPTPTRGTTPDDTPPGDTPPDNTTPDDTPPDNITPEPTPDGDHS